LLLERDLEIVTNVTGGGFGGMRVMPPGGSSNSNSNPNDSQKQHQ